MRFVFTTEETVSRADEVVDYLLGPRLWIPRTDYPDFDDWVARAHAQLKREEKRAVLATCGGGELAGIVVYQRMADDPDALEIKNITVRPDQRGRHVASFLLRSAEHEGARDFGCSRAVVDSKAGNLGMASFLVRCGYLPSSLSDLYGLGAGPDVTYAKGFNRPARL